MKAIILAGGSGTRLWPLSRENYPKQFLKLNGGRSLLQQTVERVLKVVPAEDIIIISNKEYKFHVRSDLGDLGHIILEPLSKNTAPAIALGIKYCLEILGCKKNEVLFVSPSDHIIRPVDEFAKFILLAEEAAKKGSIVTLGIKPTKPETGYGYIKVRGQGSGVRGQEVERFTEKPDLNLARQYLNEGSYYWNSGMFLFKIETMMEEFEKYAPQLNKMLDLKFDLMISNFDQMPEISLDYAVMEKSENVSMQPLELFWSDVGSWDSLYEVLDKDENGNVEIGDVITIDTKETLVIGSKRLISTIGLKECLIIDTDDALLIARRGETQKTRTIVGKLKEGNRKEAAEHTTVHRPWGNYTVLEEGPRSKVKKIVVHPHEKLSLQMHHHRSEHWVVIKGTAKVTIGDKEAFISENESIYVSKSTLHRLENPGKVPLEIIEVQNGEYVGEDDIVRIEDIYGR